MAKKKGDERSPEATLRTFERALRRALKTPPGSQVAARKKVKRSRKSKRHDQS